MSYSWYQWQPKNAFGSVLRKPRRAADFHVRIMNIECYGYGYGSG